MLVEEPDTATTVLVSSVKFLNEDRELAKKFWQAHRELTDWILQNQAEAQRIVQAELVAETRAEMSGELIARAWKRMKFKSEIPRASIQAFVSNSQKAGFMRTAPDLVLWYFPKLTPPPSKSASSAGSRRNTSMNRGGDRAIDQGNCSMKHLATFTNSYSTPAGVLTRRKPLAGINPLQGEVAADRV